MKTKEILSMLKMQRDSAKVNTMSSIELDPESKAFYSGEVQAYDVAIYIISQYSEIEREEQRDSAAGL